jgi:hypothetical protein
MGTAPREANDALAEMNKRRFARELENQKNRTSNNIVRRTKMSYLEIVFKQGFDIWCREYDVMDFIAVWCKSGEAKSESFFKYDISLGLFTNVDQKSS